MLSLALGMRTHRGPLRGCSWGVRGGGERQRECEPAGVLVVWEQGGRWVSGCQMCTLVLVSMF